MDNRCVFSGIELSTEIEDMAIKLAAYNILVELKEEGMLTDEELLNIKEIYEIPIE